MIESKIDKCVEHLKGADKATKNFLPKIQNDKMIGRFHIHKKNPDLFDFESYKLNPWEEDNIVLSKYKDFMNKPISKLDKI